MLCCAQSQVYAGHHRRLLLLAHVRVAGGRAKPGESL